jgi:tetratricopeptide (TPR) repeat protein
MRLPATFGLLLGLLAACSASALPSDAELATLAEKCAEQPDDPALVRALARARLERGEVDAALAALRGFAARHPEAASALAQLVGRAHYANGDLPAARAALEQAIAHRDEDALAHFYLGLVLVRSGEREAAGRELERAAELDPSLASQARDAYELALAAEPSDPKRRIFFAGGSGLEYDTNPTLEGREPLTSLASDEDDFRLASWAVVAAELIRTDEGALSASYRFDETRHDDLEELDLESHSAGLGGVAPLGRRTFVRLDGAATLYRLDHSGYLKTVNVSPGLGLALENHGLLQLRALADKRDYQEEPSLSSLERDGWRLGGVLQHSVPVELWAPGTLTTQLLYARMLTDAETDPLGFESAFDSHWVSLDAGLRVPVGLGIRLESRLLVGYERFDEPNVVEFLSEGDPSPDRRRDTVIDASLSLIRPLTSLVDLELRLRETRHVSNVDAYDWDRQVVGTYLRLHFAP